MTVVLPQKALTLSAAHFLVRTVILTYRLLPLSPSRHPRGATRASFPPRTRTLLGPMMRPRPVSILCPPPCNATLILVGPTGQGRRQAPLNFPAILPVLLALSYLRKSEENEAAQTIPLSVILCTITRLPFLKGNLDRRRCSFVYMGSLESLLR